MSRLSIALCALTLVASGCDSDPADSAEFDVLPLSIGSSWTMEETATVFFEDGAPVDTMIDDAPRRATMEVVRDTLIAGERWSRIEFTSERRFASTLMFGNGAWFTHRESSLYRLDGDGDAELIYGLDVLPGQPVLSNETREVVLADREAVVRVPAGDVPAAVFTQTDKSLQFAGRDRLPISPLFPTTQALSPTAGPVVLEVLYATRSRDGTDTFVPFRLKRFELVRGDA